MSVDAAAKKIFALIEPVVLEEGCELVDVEFVTEGGFRTLRVSIDKEGGVIVDDCSKVSSAIEDLIDVEGGISGRYHLEVSSPGLNRPLTKPQHFAKALGKTVKIELADKQDGRKNFKGIVKESGADALVITVDEADFTITYKSIRKASLVAFA